MRGELTREDVSQVAAQALVLWLVNRDADKSEPLATQQEREAFRALLVAIGEAVEDGYRAA